MAGPRFAWGIDIGNRALKAVKLVRDGDRLRVDDFELIEHEHVLSNAGDNRDALIQTAIANFVQKHPVKGGGVASVGVSGQSSFARFIKLPPVEPKKIPEIVKFEAIQQIPFPLDDVEWGYQLFQAPDSPDVEVGIFAMRKELIARHIKFFTDVDMNVQVVQMNPLAVYNAVFYDQRLKGTTMVIDLGAENTDLIICDNDSVWMRSIPIGGNSFTETLVKGFRLPFAKAEDLKRNAATSKYARQIFQAMRPVFADLVAEIQRSVGFYASVHRDSRIKRIIALGGTFRLPGLQKYLQQNLSLDVERLDNLSAGAPADPKQAATFNENLLSVVGAYGLAVQAMGEGKITSSLLPAAIRREKLWKEKTSIFISTAGLFCLGTGIAMAGYFLQNVSYNKAEQTREKISGIETQARKLDQQWSSDIETAGGSDRAIITNVRNLTKYRNVWADLLKDIEAALPTPQQAVVDGYKQKKPELIKSVKRNEREMIVLRQLMTRYDFDMTAQLDPKLSDLDFTRLYFFEAASVVSSVISSADAFDPNAVDSGGGGADAGLFGEAPPPMPVSGAGGPVKPHGFRIIIKGTCPMEYSKATTFIDEHFVNNLKKIGPNAQRPNLEYKVEKAAIGGFYKVRETNARTAEMLRVYNAALSFRRNLMGEAAPQPQPARSPTGAPVAEDISPYLDRLTDEDVRDDTDFTILISVTMDPKAYEPPPETPAAAAQ